MKKPSLLPLLVVLATIAPATAIDGARAAGAARVRILAISYVAHNGAVRRAYVVVPAWYGPHDDPPIPLVISPHGRGVRARRGVHYWGALPALGHFAVVSPEGQGRRFALYSWGYPGQISDLAKMPDLVHKALPWLRIDRARIYAVGGSMGGQETLLLVARYPHLLAGAISFDAPTNLALRYYDFAKVPFERGMQQLAADEVGGTPATVPRAYALRSPIDYARAIAFSGVPLEIWWSADDRIVIDQTANSGALYRRIVSLNPLAPVREVVGEWSHSAEMWYYRRLPFALRRIGLLPPRSRRCAAIICRLGYGARNRDELSSARN